MKLFLIISTLAVIAFLSIMLYYTLVAILDKHHKNK